MAKSRPNKIAFQGEPGANSHLACSDAYPDMEALPSPTFEDALAAVKSGARMPIAFSSLVATTAATIAVQESIFSNLPIALEAFAETSSSADLGVSITN